LDGRSYERAATGHSREYGSGSSANYNADPATDLAERAKAMRLIGPIADDPLLAFGTKPAPQS
jgi:hypothetical protein